MTMVVLCLAILLAGCAFGEEERIDEAALERIVLQPADLPRVFYRFDEGRQIRADAPGGARADPERFGRSSGWKARYRRPGSPATEGPLVVESRVDLFSDEEGAEQDLEALRSGLDDVLPGATPLDAPDLGEEAVAATSAQGGGPFAVRFYLVAWRDANVTASVLVNGFARRTTLAAATSLARKQQRRIDAAR